MAQVLLLSATAPEDDEELHRAPLLEVRRCAARDRFGSHSITSDPNAADVILFVENYGAGWHFERAREHEFTRRFREKCFVFCSIPYVIPLMPGIYTGIEKRWQSRRTVSGFYLGPTCDVSTKFTPPTADLPNLYSFVGSFENAPVRRHLASLVHPRGLLLDTSADWKRVLAKVMPAAERGEYERRFAQATTQSKFVLCPRGLSVSTIRLFETMQMGRVPVILADGWVPPPGPPWESFSIRVRERDYAQIPQMLEEREGDAVAMGEAARRVWLDWFSEEAIFHRCTEWCLGIAARRVLPETLSRMPAFLHYLRPFHLKRLLRRKFRG